MRPLHHALPLLVLSTLLTLSACSRPKVESHGTTSSSATTKSPAAPATPCQSDTDCRLVACQECTCGGVHRSDPDGCPPAICVAWPCAGMAAACDVGTHRCRSVKAPPADATAP